MVVMLLCYPIMPVGVGVNLLKLSAGTMLIFKPFPAVAVSPYSGASYAF